MKRTVKALIAATGATALAVSAVGIAAADTVTVDGDTAHAVNNFIVTSCTGGVTSAAATSSGVVTISSTGVQNGSHFLQGGTATAHSQVSGPVTVGSDDTAVVPQGFNGNSNPPKTFSIPVSATVPAGTSPLSQTVTVTVTGPEWKNGQGATGGTVTLTATYDVVVSCSDSTPPSLSLPANQTVEATSASGAAVSYTATATDAVDGAVTPSCSPSSGSTFALGTTTVNCSATDLAGNTSSSSFTVTVRDTTPPTVTAPANVSGVEATGPSGATVTYGAASATDVVDGTVSTSCSPASGSTFAIGTTTVTCSATDAHSNTGSATFTVSVGDTVPPAVTVPGNQLIEATGPSGAAYTYSPAPSASDAVAGAPAVTCNPVSGSTFAITTTHVTCSASDGTNTGYGYFDVTVQDTRGPALSGIPATATLEATSSTGAPLASFAPSATDVVDGARSVVCANDATHAVITSATVYALDETTHVTCTASDTHGNTSTATYAITVEDTTGPDLANLSDIGPLEGNTLGGRVVSYTITAQDIVDGTVTAVCTPASGTKFAVGTTPVSCTATDSRDNASDTKGFNVIVQDTTPPTIALHGTVTEEATSASGALVSYTSPSTSDIVDGAGTATCAPASGTQFALGNTTVTCNASDAASNAATPTTFTVSVVDTTPPVIASHGTVTAEATSSSGAAVTYTSPATSDAVDGNGTASCLPASGSTFALGNTTVTCNAADAASNAATPTTFTVTVVDTTAPVIASHADVYATATSSSGAVVTYTSPGWTDAVDVSGTATCTPVSGGTFPIGSTQITCNATDTHGNAATPTSFNVIVSYGWHGFFQPIDVEVGHGNDSTVRGTTIFNKAKAGSTIPVKFDLSGNMGLDIFAAGYPKAVKVTCPANPTVDGVEETTTTTSGLKYDATMNAPYGQYNYAWKTATSYAGTCQRLEVKLNDSSPSQYAFFQFTK
jgi:hypothetical protein